MVKSVINRLFLYTLICSLLISCNQNRSGNRVRSDRKTSSNELNGTVIKIVDGDTYDLLTVEKQTIRIRMNAIDAPERGQPFYQKLKDFLGQLCFKKVIRVKKTDTDRNGRIIGESYTSDNVSLSEEMIRNGFAWHYKMYSNDERLSELEIEAKNQKIGLWIDPNPIPPWQIRTDRRNGKKDSEE